MSENLWPPFDGDRPRTIRGVLLEAGEGLAERTGGKVRFDVESRPAAKARLVHDCYLVVPALAYRYPYCKVTEEGDPYPVTLVGDATFARGAAAGNEAALIENLRLLFHSDETKRAVQQLLDAAS